MANISTVTGDITLKGRAESVSAFVKLMRIFEEFYYGTEIDVYDLADVEKLPKDEIIERTYGLSGMGRWNYKQTLKNMFELLVETKEVYDMGRKSIEIDWSEEMDVSWHILDEYPIAVEIDYFELELGAGFLLSSNTSISWRKGHMDNLIVDENKMTDYEVNAKNIYNLLGEICFDYTAYTIELLDEVGNIDWDKNIQKYIRDAPNTKKLKDKDSEEYHTFITKLKERLNENTETKAFWNDIDGWFEDEFIQESIMNII